MAHFAQKRLFCPDCGGAPTVAGCCPPCYARRRHSRIYFAGVRQEVLERDGYHCQGCQRSRGAGNQPSVHHRRPGVYEIRWLVTICPRCHAVIHKLQSHRRWLPVSLLELWREQHPAVPLQLQLPLEKDGQGREAAAR